MQKQEVTRYYCPFAREMCREGNLQLQAEAPVRCKFWVTDISPQRCELLAAIMKLENLDVIATALQTLAAEKGNNTSKFR